VSLPGLPDGFFSNQKYQFWYILEGLGMDIVGIFYGHLEYFTAIGYILWPFGIFSGIWGTFLPFWYVVLRKIWQPWSPPRTDSVKASHMLTNFLKPFFGKIFLKIFLWPAPLCISEVNTETLHIKSSAQKLHRYICSS
jgi:hypothetical protein